MISSRNVVSGVFWASTCYMFPVCFPLTSLTDKRFNLCNFVSSCFKEARWGGTMARSQLAPRDYHVLESFPEKPWAQSSLLLRDRVCLFAAKPAVHEIWLSGSADAPACRHALTHSHTWTNTCWSSVIGRTKPKDKTDKISLPAFVRCACVRVVFCVSVQMPWHTFTILKPGNFLWSYPTVTAAGA